MPPDVSAGDSDRSEEDTGARHRRRSGAGSRSRSWLDFWNSDNPIYVNDRHREIHYRRVADDIISEIPPQTSSSVLDYGCGVALDAARVAGHCRSLWLYDAAFSVRSALRERFAGNAGIRVVESEDLGEVPRGSVDLFVVNSVLQYLRPEELPPLLERARRCLKPDGRLILADIPGPKRTMVADCLDLLRVARRNGFVPAALRGLVRTFFSDYRRLIRDLGFTTFSETEMRTLLAAHGFTVERRPVNFGFSRSRATYIARPGRQAPADPQSPPASGTTP